MLQVNEKDLYNKINELTKMVKSLRLENQHLKNIYKRVENMSSLALKRSNYFSKSEINSNFLNHLDNTIFESGDAKKEVFSCFEFNYGKFSCLNNQHYDEVILLEDCNIHNAYVIIQNNVVSRFALYRCPLYRRDDKFERLPKFPFNRNQLTIKFQNAPTTLKYVRWCRYLYSKCLIPEEVIITQTDILNHTASVLLIPILEIYQFVIPKFSLLAFQKFVIEFNTVSLVEPKHDLRMVPLIIKQKRFTCVRFLNEVQNTDTICSIVKPPNTERKYHKNMVSNMLPSEEVCLYRLPYSHSVRIFDEPSSNISITPLTNKSLSSYMKRRKQTKKFQQLSKTNEQCSTAISDNLFIPLNTLNIVESNMKNMSLNSGNVKKQQKNSQIFDLKKDMLETYSKANSTTISLIPSLTIDDIPESEITSANLSSMNYYMNKEELVTYNQAKSLANKFYKAHSTSPVLPKAPNITNFYSDKLPPSGVRRSRTQSLQLSKDSDLNKRNKSMIEKRLIDTFAKLYHTGIDSVNTNKKPRGDPEKAASHLWYSKMGCNIWTQNTNVKFDQLRDYLEKKLKDFSEDKVFDSKRLFRHNNHCEEYITKDAKTLDCPDESFLDGSKMTHLLPGK